MRIMRAMCMTMLVCVVIVMLVLVAMGVMVVMPMIIVIRMVMPFMIGMIIVIGMIVMVVCFEQSPFADVQKLRAIGFQQGGHGRPARQRIDRTFQPGGQILTHPEHQIGLLQRGGFGRTQIVFMGRSAGRHDQVGAAYSGHNPRHQRMDRRNIDGHARRICHGRAPQQDRSDRFQDKRSGHRTLCVIL